MINLDEMVKRLLEVKGLSQGKEAAETLGISPADLSNRKKRGTLLPLLVEWAVKEKINLHWFITGEKERDIKKTTNRKFVILDQVEEWLNEEVKMNPKNEVWFEMDFEKKFEGFKKWKEEKEESGAATDTTPTRKVA